MNKGQIIAGIDIGTAKVTTIIAVQSQETENINVIGVATVLSKGLRRSQIVDIEEAIEAIEESVEAAERMAGYSISKAFVSIGGAHIDSSNSQGVVAVAEPEGEIVKEDIDRVIEAARAISLPASREIIHVIPRDFTVDSQKGISDPIGMTGVRLEADTHIITGSSTAMKNLIKCVEDLGIKVEGLVFSGLAASESVLTKTEKELGVCLVEIGGGTTSIAVFVEGSLAFSSVLPIGAKNITNDLAIGLRLSLASAEKIKIALSKENSLEKTINAKGKQKNKEELDLKKLGIEEDLDKISKKTAIEGIIRPRLNEIFQMVGERLTESNFGASVPAGIVLSGGGAKTVGIVKSCRRILSLPARVGFPKGLSGLTEEIKTTEFSVPYGLIFYGLRNSEKISGRSFSLDKIKELATKIPLGGAIRKIIDFIKSFLP